MNWDKLDYISPGRLDALNDASRRHEAAHVSATFAIWADPSRCIYWQEYQAFWFQQRARLLWLYECLTGDEA